MDADALSRENAHLKARLAEVEAALAEVQEANRRLEGILRASQRERFGKSSEKLSPDQFNLPLEDAELAQGVLEAAQEKAEAALARARGDEPRKPKRNRGHLPPDLPRVERGECPIFCVSVIWSMLPERSKDDDDFERTAGRTAEGLQAA